MKFDGNAIQNGGKAAVIGKEIKSFEGDFCVGAVHRIHAVNGISQSAFKQAVRLEIADVGDQVVAVIAAGKGLKDLPGIVMAMLKGIDARQVFQNGSLQLTVVCMMSSRLFCQGIPYAPVLGKERRYERLD